MRLLQDLTIVAVLGAIAACGGSDDNDEPPPPEPCAADERVEAGECVACAAGTTNGAGDDPAGDDTTCDAVICAENEQVLANACAACPAGSTNSAGDDASGADTACDPTLCGTDERVVANACAPCPAGEINEAGDDASGADTDCRNCELADWIGVFRGTATGMCGEFTSPVSITNTEFPAGRFRSVWWDGDSGFDFPDRDPPTSCSYAAGNLTATLTSMGQTWVYVRAGELDCTVTVSRSDS